MVVLYLPNTMTVLKTICRWLLCVFPRIARQVSQTSFSPFELLFKDASAMAPGRPSLYQVDLFCASCICIHVAVGLLSVLLRAYPTHFDTQSFSGANSAQYGGSYVVVAGCCQNLTQVDACPNLGRRCRRRRRLWFAQLSAHVPQWPCATVPNSVAARKAARAGILQRAP